MKDPDEIRTDNYLPVFRNGWLVISLIAVLLTVAVFVTDMLNLIKHPMPNAAPMADRVIFYAALLLIIALVLYKRNALNSSNIIEKVSASTPSGFSSFRQAHGWIEDQLSRAVYLLYRNMRNIWFLSLTLPVLGLVHYVFVGKTFNAAIFSLVGLYVLAVNYPFRSRIESVVYKFSE